VPPSRLPGLDALRTVAVVLVIGHHLPPPPADWPAYGLFLAWHRGGWVGVDLFFVLSGFLVSGLLFTEFRATGRISPARFYVRRWWRIYPPLLYLTVISTVYALALGGDVPDIRRRMWAELLFVQNFVSGLWLHTWSLAVEEHFYLLLPPTLWLLLRRRGAVLCTAGAVGFACLGLRVLTATLWAYNPATHVYPTYLRLDGLWLGVALSYLYHGDHARIRRWAPWSVVLLVAGVALLVPVFLVPLDAPAIYTVGFTVSALAGAFLVVGALLAPFPSVLQPLATIGALSYSIYLWHMPVLTWVLPWLPGSPTTVAGFGLRLGVGVAGSIVVGLVMAHAVERPALAIRDRWWPART
jgi:peptidoglycan/LPS O-acetylase OafA/YrhL